MKRSIICVLLVFSMLFCSIPTVFAEGNGEFVIEFRGDCDLSGIDIKVYRAELTYADDTGFAVYDETLAFTVTTDASGKVSFEHPSERFSITVDLATLPEGYGIDRHTVSLTNKAKNYGFGLSKIEKTEVEKSGDRWYTRLCSARGAYIHALYETKVVEEASYSKNSLRVGLTTTVIVTAGGKEYVTVFKENKTFETKYHRNAVLWHRGLITEGEFLVSWLDYLESDAPKTYEDGIPIFDGTAVWHSFKNYIDSGKGETELSRSDYSRIKNYLYMRQGTRIDDGVYKITNVGAGKCLNIYGNKLTKLSNGRNVTLWQDSGSNEQKWAVSTVKSGETYISSVIDGDFGLNVYRKGDPFNCNIRKLAGNEYDARVIFIKTDGGFKIKLKNYAMFLTASSDENGANVYWAEESESEYQVWDISAVE